MPSKEQKEIYTLSTSKSYDVFYEVKVRLRQQLSSPHCGRNAKGALKKCLDLGDLSLLNIFYHFHSNIYQ